MNSGYMHYIKENDTWYHVPEQWHADFLSLKADIKAAKTNKDLDDLLEELEEDYGQNARNIDGMRCVIYDD